MSKYRAFCEQFDEHVWSVDRRHVEIIRRFLLTVKHKVANVVEVGCAHGVSTEAILDAADERKFRVDLIDLRFSEQVLGMAKAAGRGVTLHQANSVDVLGSLVGEDTVVFLDGDHKREHVAKEAAVLTPKLPLAVILHDAANVAHDCDGPPWLMHHLQAIGYFAALDSLPRSGERTERGLAIMSRTPAVAEAATDACAAFFEAVP